MLTLHVEPHNGTWVVRPENDPRPLSHHADAGAATLAACARVRDDETARVLVHDRYHRVVCARPPSLSRAARAAR